MEHGRSTVNDAYDLTGDTSDDLQGFGPVGGTPVFLPPAMATPAPPMGPPRQSEPWEQPLEDIFRLRRIRR